MADLEKTRRNQQAAVLNAPRIARIVERALPQRVLKSFELLNGGGFNLSYLLRFEKDETPVVLRIFTNDPSACQKEVDLLYAVSGLLPVPEVIYAETTGEEDIGPYLSYRHVEGITFQELKSHGNLQDMAEAAYAIGAVLARLQRISFALPVPAGPMSPVEVVAAKCLASPVLGQRLGVAGRDRLYQFVSEWLPMLRHLDQDRALVHGDFSNRNILVRREGHGWMVAGILDWESAFLGSPLWDAARFICFERQARPCREPHFSRGFAESGGSLPENWRACSRAINALTSTESLTRPDLPERFVPDLRELIAATLNDRDLS